MAIISETTSKITKMDIAFGQRNNFKKSLGRNDSNYDCVAFYAASNKENRDLHNLSRFGTPVADYAASNQVNRDLQNLSRSGMPVADYAASNQVNRDLQNLSRSGTIRVFGTIMLEIYTGRTITTQVTNAEGFTSIVEVPQFASCTFCKDSIDYYACIAMGDRQMAEELAHDHTLCGLTHYNPARFGGQKLCGAAIAAVPCRFGSRCNLLHPKNKPQVTPASMMVSGASAGSTASVASGAPRHQAGGAGRPQRKFNAQMCWKNLCDVHGVSLPDGIESCKGGCGFAHDERDQTSTPAQIEFMRRVEKGELDVQAILDEVVKSFMTLSFDDRAAVLKKTNRARAPALCVGCNEEWVRFWAKAAGAQRKEKAELVKKGASVESFPTLALFGGEDSMEENIVWELSRLFQVCYRSTTMLDQEMGGKKVLAPPGQLDSDDFEVRHAVRLQLEKKQQLRTIKIEALDNDACDAASKVKLRTELGELNTEIKKMEREVDRLFKVSLCPHGKNCKSGAHVQYVGKDGVLNTVDCDNFNGRKNRNRSDIIEKRIAIKKEMDELNAERTFKNNQMEGGKIMDKAERHTTQLRMMAIKDQLASLRYDYINCYNKIILCPENKPMPCVKWDVFVPILMSNADIDIELDLPDIPVGDIKADKEREWRQSLYAFVAKMKAKKVVRAKELLCGAIHQFRVNHSKKVRAITCAKTDQEAQTLFYQLIQSKHYILLKVEENTKIVRGKTGDGRIIFYYKDGDDKFYTADSYGVLHEAVQKSTPSLRREEDMFDLALFKEYYSAGAFRAMSFAYYINNFYREAWSYFSQSTSSWDDYIESVMAANEKWNLLGIVVEKVHKCEKWNGDGDNFDLVEHEVPCPEKEKFHNFWAYYFDIPKMADKAVVGDAGDLAIQAPNLFAKFQTIGTKQTFSSWLLAENDFFMTKDTPTFEAWLEVNRERKHYRQGYLAWVNKTYPGHTWHTVYNFVNFVQTTDSSITIDSFKDNMYYTLKWVGSDACRNIGAEFGGVTLTTFLSEPESYLEYYEHNYHIRQTPFQNFKDDKKAGWLLVRPTRMRRVEVLSLAWLPFEHAKKVVDAMRTQLWRPFNMVEFDEKPSVKIIFINNNQMLSVPRSVCDDMFVELLKEMIKSKPSVSALTNLLEKLPTTQVAAEAQLEQMCTDYTAQVMKKQETACTKFFTTISHMSCCKGIRPEWAASVGLIETQNNIRLIIQKLAKRKQDELKAEFDSLCELMATDVEANKSIIRSTMTTSVHNLQVAETKGDMVEMKTVVPYIITKAREIIAKQQIKEETVANAELNKKTNKLVQKEKVCGKNIAPIGNAFAGLQPDEDEFADPAAKLLQTFRQQTPLQEAARLPIRGNTTMYFDRIKITKEREEKKTFTYWAFGPFESQSAASIIQRVANKHLKACGVSITKFNKPGHQTVHEVIIPDGADKVNKAIKKWDLTAANSQAMHSEVVEKMADLLEVLTKAVGITSANVFAPGLPVKETKKASNQEDDMFEESDEEDDNSSTSSDDSSSSSDSEDSEDEVIIGKIMMPSAISQEWKSGKTIRSEMSAGGFGKTHGRNGFRKSGCFD